MLLLTNNVGDPQKLIDMKFSIYSYIKMKYFALKKVVCGGLGWFAVVCGGLRYFDGAQIKVQSLVLEVKVHFYRAASLKYHAPGNWHGQPMVSTLY